jgi:hypothetical protein
MGKVYKNDFVRLRPFGSLGDKGCDGYRLSTGQVFQCYGALNGDSGKVAYLVSKMGEDYAKALVGVPSIMKEWHLAHNLVDGLPVQAIQKLEEIKKTDPARKFGFIGMESLEERIFSLGQAEIEDLLGPVATSADSKNLQIVELRELVSAIANTVDKVEFDVQAIAPVPVEKLTFNKLPNHWLSIIQGGWQNTRLVSEYFARHPEPLVGEKIAQIFRVRYQYLKTQNLSPGMIMSDLYEMVVGKVIALPARQVAAQALLAFLFESCDIFEDHPSGARV